jgi:uncharacterized protein (TIGR00255 family)
VIRSMTGFGQGRGHSGGETIAVDLRSVNGKFCEVKTHLPRELVPLEADLVKRIKARVARGMCDVHVRREGEGGRAVTPQADLPLAAAYVKALRELKAQLLLAGEPSVSDLAQLEGVITLRETPADLGAATEALHQALDAALDAHDLMRRREGAALEKDLASRLDAVEKAAAEVKRLVPSSVESARERLEARVAELTRGSAPDPQRIAQEIAFFADRTDVAEELTRLGSHLSQLRALLSQEAPAGRRLEFLLQEVNREVNTIGSKSQHAGISAQVVEVKAELERIREQIQNVE